MSGVRIFSLTFLKIIASQKILRCFFLYIEIKEVKEMTKKEFLDKLGEALLENMDVSEAMSHIQYYKEYIENEVAKGKNEKEVVAALQSPRLITKNIVINGEKVNKYSSTVSENNKKEKNSSSGTSNANENKKGMSFSINGKPINNTLTKIVLFLISFLFIVIVFAIIGAVTWLFFKFVLPIILIMCVVWVIKGIFINKK